MVGLFAPSGSSASSSTNDVTRQLVFLKLKAITVPLLDASRSPITATSTRTTLELLRDLKAVLENAPDEAFSPSLANYAFFPLSSLLQPRVDGAQRSDRILEATMQALDALVRRWRRVGMEDRVRQELWIMTILTLGGPLDPNQAGQRKGKEVDRTDEARLAMVQLLRTLLTDSSESSVDEDKEDSLGERLDWNVDGDLPRDKAARTGPPTSILFHTLTTLLALAAEPTSLLDLQTTSISALRLVLLAHLARPASTSEASSAGPSPLLATALPGSASTLSRIALSKPPRSKISLEAPSRKQASSVVVAALELLSDLIVETVGDDVTASLREKDPANLSTLTSLEDLANTAPPGSTPSDELHDNEDVETSATLPTGPTIPTPAWLRYTLTSLATLFAALSPLAAHESPVVRVALVRCVSTSILRCGETFGDLIVGPLEGLLILAGDDWDVVASPARQALTDLLERSGSSQRSHVPDLVGQIVSRRLDALPLAIRKQDDNGVERAAQVVRTALDALPRLESNGNVLSRVDRWSWNLLNAIELERIPNAAQGTASRVAIAWVNDGAAPDEPLPTFSRIRLRHLSEDRSLSALEKLWRSLGNAAASTGQQTTLVECFLGVALGPRRYESVAPSALWILEGILEGVGAREPRDKGRKKMLKGVTRAVLSFLEELEGTDEPELERDNRGKAASAGAPSRDLVIEAPDGETTLAGIVHSKGITAIPSLDEYQPVVARSTVGDDRASHRLLLISLALRTLATTSTLLGDSFQPLLLQVLYHVLSRVSPSNHPFVRSTAQTALVKIAESTGYASAGNLVLANVDYVVNSVSQRLSVTRLDPSAPLVLVEMIRLVGRPIVPIVQDLVDDVFEALDDYHGYEDLTVGLWAVLDALLKVMGEDIPAKSSRDQPVPERPNEFEAIRDWITTRREEAASSETEAVDAEDVNPRRPFGPEPGSEEPPEEPSGATDSQETPPSRPQVVTAQILSKALYFLSHPSPFLRARVLSLLASAVPLLARPSFDAKAPENRAADLLPVVHRAWPFILARFAEPDLSIVVEAAGLVEALAAHVGDFMSRRILEDVWPRLRTLLISEEAEDQHTIRGEPTRYTTSHRLYRSILRTMLDVARNVPLKEDVVWDQALVFRRFLSTSADPELQTLALELYSALERVNPDSVWLVLAGTTGASDDLPAFLRMPGVSFGTNLDRVLSRA
ncbi:hypothetical protein JCM10212_003192 [Sporobolomyces blumeae]